MASCAACVVIVKRKVKSRLKRRAAIDTTTISINTYEVSAKNFNAVVHMLKPICDGETVGDHLSKFAASGGWAYDDANLTARYVARHGEKLKCFTVTGRAKDEATAIAADSDVGIVRTTIAFRRMLSRARKSLVE